MGISHSLFAEKLEKLKDAKGVKLDTELTASDLKQLVEQYKNVYVEAKGEKFPSGIVNHNHLPPMACILKESQKGYSVNFLVMRVNFVGYDSVYRSQKTVGVGGQSSF